MNKFYIVSVLFVLLFLIGGAFADSVNIILESKASWDSFDVSYDCQPWNGGNGDGCRLE